MAGYNYVAMNRQGKKVNGAIEAKDESDLRRQLKSQGLAVVSIKKGKGIGAKKADQIIEYRKTNTIKSPEDLKNIKGFGDSIVTNVKSANTPTVPTKQDLTKKVDTIKDDKKKELSNSVDKKIEKTTGTIVPKL